jgi:hypothetical protein
MRWYSAILKSKFHISDEVYGMFSWICNDLDYSRLKNPVENSKTTFPCLSLHMLAFY